MPEPLPGAALQTLLESDGWGRVHRLVARLKAFQTRERAARLFTPDLVPAHVTAAPSSMPAAAAAAAAAATLPLVNDARCSSIVLSSEMMASAPRCSPSSASSSSSSPSTPSSSAVHYKPTRLVYGPYTGEG